jgi:soluble lytic murein transglycosylase
MQDMTRLGPSMAAALCLCLALLFPAPLTAQADRPLGLALQDMKRGEWTDAQRRARQDGPVAADIVEWHRLRAGFGTYDELLAFLDRRPDWLGLDWLVRKSEPAFEFAPREVVLDHFAKHPPQTAEGHLILARARAAAGQAGEAEATLVLAWRKG